VRLGIFGGSFDPPHAGHLLAASDAYEALGLDRLVFVPAGTQPLKAGAAEALPAQRLAMVGLMTAGDARFVVDPIEIDRSGLSYTVDTLSSFAARYPDARRFLLIGEDVVYQLAAWRQPERIAELAEIVILARADGASAAERSGTGRAAVASVLPMTRLATRRVDVSSTEIRARVRAGRSIRGFVSDGVAEFIRAAGLYR
jgi:nicotinate-nucleotide adenylyltransferase